MNSERQYFPILLVVVIVILLLLTRCVPAESPDNLEPSLRIDSISGISRTEATVNVNIRHNGPARLDRIYLCYAQTSGAATRSASAQFTRVEIKPTSTAVKLTQLRPGTSYSCHLEGETATARIVSEQTEFSSIPNGIPSISKCAILSQGPTGVILEVQILDNGGDPVEAVAFTRINLATGESVEHRIANPDLSTSTKVRAAIKNLTPGTRYSFAYRAENRNGVTHGNPFEIETGTTYMVDTPGSLPLIIDAASPFGEKSITVHGPIDSSDISLLRLLLLAPDASGNASKAVSILEQLDLAECMVTTGSVPYDGEHFTVADEVTAGMFGNCPQLRAIRLPNSATHVRRDALRGCASLEHIEIGTDTRSVDVSQECAALKAVEVSKANQWYRSIDGVLFNAEATAILWLPLGKTDPLHLPETVTEIGELAFAGSRIEIFFLPATLTTLKRYAFSSSAITEITIPDKVVKIPEGAFQNCGALKKVTLGKGVEYIENHAFSGTPVADLYVEAPYPPVVAAAGFRSGAGSITASCTLHVPAASRELYRNHPSWGTFNRIVSL